MVVYRHKRNTTKGGNPMTLYVYWGNREITPEMLLSRAGIGLNDNSPDARIIVTELGEAGFPKYPWRIGIQSREGFYVAIDFSMRLTQAIWELDGPLNGYSIRKVEPSNLAIQLLLNRLDHSDFAVRRAINALKKSRKRVPDRELETLREGLEYSLKQW